MWYILFKNINYLDTIRKKDQIDENDDLIECKMKMRTQLNKHNEI